MCAGWPWPDLITYCTVSTKNRPVRIVCLFNQIECIVCKYTIRPSKSIRNSRIHVCKRTSALHVHTSAYRMHNLIFKQTILVCILHLYAGFTCLGFSDKQDFIVLLRWDYLQYFWVPLVGVCLSFLLLFLLKYIYISHSHTSNNYKYKWAVNNSRHIQYSGQLVSHHINATSLFQTVVRNSLSFAECIHLSIMAHSHKI